MFYAAGQCCSALQLAQDELDDRSILAQLNSAMQVGCVISGDGQLSVRDIDVDSLSAAVQYALHLSPKTQNAAQMLATAQLVLALRQAFVRNDLAHAQQLLESVRGKVIAAVAANEVQAVKTELDNWTVISQLSAAFSSGQAQVRFSAMEISGAVIRVHVCFLMRACFVIWVMLDRVHLVSSTRAPSKLEIWMPLLRRPCAWVAELRTPSGAC
jgi:hypothetical protein